MRRLLLLTFAGWLLCAVACNDATSPTQSTHRELRPPQRTLVVPSTTPQVSTGHIHTCALRWDGSVICWVGNPAYAGAAVVPPGLDSVAQLSAGGFHTCALKTGGTVVCWGDGRSEDDHGQASVPPALGPVVQVSAGTYHTCAVKTDQTVACWGGNDGSLIDQGQYFVPSDLGPVIQVSAGGFHTCALKVDETVTCWGYNDADQTIVPPDLDNVLEISSGYRTSCARRVDMTVICWGANQVGQAAVPAGLADALQLSTGAGASCVIRIGSSAQCWGDESGYYYGLKDIPANIGPVAQVSIKYLHACALATNGTVRCWGDNGDGRLAVPFCLNLYGPMTCQPLVGAISAANIPAPVNTATNASANFAEPGAVDTHTAVFDWGDGTSSVGMVTEAGGSGSASGHHAYSVPGVYTITLLVTDQHGNTGQSVFEFVVVYDPAAGFVTGGGWINSPAGAYIGNASLTGKANFGFVSRYQKGTTIPTGNTQFQFQTGDLRFSSSSYDWLVIAGAQAKYKGSGTINGAGNFGFMLSAVDGAVNGGGGIDKFRIKIWNKLTGSIIYDNQIGASDDAIAAGAIAGGDIVIHK